MHGSKEILNDFAIDEYYEITAESRVNSDILNYIFDDIPLIMILVNRDGKVENINRTTTIALGKEKKDAFGLLGGELFGCVNSIKGEGCGKNRECSECAIRNSVMHTFETGESIYKKEGELEIVNNDRSITFNFLVSTTLIRQNDDLKVSLILDDISEIKQTNRLVERKLEIEKAISSISSMFVSSKDIDSNIVFALENICNLCGSSRSYVFLFHDDGILMDNTHEYCPEGVEPHKDNLQDLPVDMFPWWMNKLHNGESIHIKDVLTMPEEASAEKEILEMQEIKSLIVLPLHANNELVGFIGLDNVVNTGEWGEEDLAILRMASHIIGHSIGLKEADNKLLENEKKYSNIVENGNDGIIILQDFVLKYANKMMLDISEYSIEDVIGKPFIDFVSSEYADFIKERYKRRLSGEDVPNHYEIEIITKNGKVIPVDINASTIEYEGRAADMAILRDITERKRVQEEMLQARILAEDLNRSKTEFIMNMSHEIRTPLNSVIGFSQVLLEHANNIDEKQAHYIENIHINGKHLLELFNEIIDISKIENGEMEFHPTNFFIPEVIGEIETLMKPLAFEKKVIFTQEIDFGNIILKADRAKIKHILYNLVHNAIKFTPKAGHVAIETKKCGESMCFFVKDTGVGISPTDHNKLFEQFSQVDSSTTRQYGGIGMGLNIVKRFVEIHGGEVWVESELGKGSTFGFSIPTDPENTSQ
ncbi:ATP-binding protein [Methanococcoides sp. AM1]|uniref:ATP-binding protein n=1 Tax=Methanococcoides sp. AM1 TaxID=1201011 RepID=UPI0014382A6E|nr:ATP-binding protein [Methanococcoides sp. AM1]